MKITRRKIELIILGILIIVLFVYARHFERTHIYFPEKFVEGSRYPDDYGLKYEEINLVTKDNVKINSWFIPADKALATFLFCHGNAGNDSDRLVSLQSAEEAEAPEIAAFREWLLDEARREQGKA